MRSWKFFAKMAVPCIRSAGEMRKAEDPDNVGTDDVIGTSLVYVADLLESLINDGKNLPKAPAILSK